MENADITPEDKRHLQNLSVIPAAVAVYILIAYFLYTIRNQQFSLLYSAAYFIIAFLIVVPAVTFLSEEILYSRRAKKPLAYHIRRFLRRMLISFLGVLVTSTIFGVTYLSLSSTVDERSILVLTGVFSFVVWGIIVLRLRRTLGRLAECGSHG